MIQRMTSSKEFVRWKIYLDQEANEFNPEYYYYALIAMVIAKVNSEHPEKIKLDDFLLKFETREITKKKVPSQEQALTNKRSFLASLGVNLDSEGIDTGKIRKTPKNR